MKKDNLFLEVNDEYLNASNLVNKESISNNISVSDVILNKESAKKLNKEVGIYKTIYYSDDALTKEVDTLIDLVEKSIRDTLNYLNLSKNSKVLFVGLGNKSLAVDKLGYLVIEKIVANNNMYKIYKDIETLTNIDSQLFIKMLVKELGVDLVVVFDSFKAKSIERLGTTIQITTGEMIINNKKISKKTIKTNMIGIGVPSLIDLKSIKEDNPKLLVTVDLIDEIIENSSSILSIAINRIF